MAVLKHFINFFPAFLDSLQNHKRIQQIYSWIYEYLFYKWGKRSFFYSFVDLISQNLWWAKLQLVVIETVEEIWTDKKKLHKIIRWGIYRMNHVKNNEDKYTRPINPWNNKHIFMKKHQTEYEALRCWLMVIKLFFFNHYNWVVNLIRTGRPCAKTKLPFVNI